MKKISIFSILLFVVAAFTACEDTNENLVKYNNDYVVPVITNLKPAFYTSDLENSYIKFDVSLPENQKVESAWIEVVFKGKTGKVADIANFPSTITLKATDAINTLSMSNSDVEINDDFTFYVVTSNKGHSTRSQAAVVAFVTCEYDQAKAVGTYEAVSDDWQAKGTVNLEADPENPFKIYVSGIYEMDGGAPNDNKLIINIDPGSFKLSGPKCKLGPHAPWGKYTNYYYEVIGGLYKSCDGKYEVVVKITVDEGAFGTFNYVFTRK